MGSKDQSPQQISFDTLVPEGRSRRFVRVMPEIQYDECFDYEIPEGLESPLRGQRVHIPWGKKQIIGIVIDHPDQPEVEHCRALLGILDEPPQILPEMIELAEWMAEYYCAPFAQILKGMVPEQVREEKGRHLEQYKVELVTELEDQEVVERLKGAKVQLRAWKALKEMASTGQENTWLSVLLRETRTSQSTWKGLANKGVIRLDRVQKERNPFKDQISAEEPLQLNQEQADVISSIREFWSKGDRKPILIQGVTGSGKTEIYLQLLQGVLQEGETGLVLVPEIALTPQTILRFRRRFEHLGVGIAVLHSRLSTGERHDQWLQIRNGKAQIVIGARSALFAPIEKLGLIIVDEEHEQSYKQEESPRYHARDVAILRAHLQQAAVVLGTATPSLESAYNAQTGKYHLLKLTQRVDQCQLPVIHLLDMKLKNKVMRQKNSQLIHPDLESAIHQRLEKREQVILFLNRRGFSTSLQCPNCGYISECDHCSVPMTYHRKGNYLICHLCDEKSDVPESCPECGFDQFKYQGTGTQKIENTIAELFPSARWQRMDSDAMTRKDSFETTLKAFGKGEIDILIGTQMIAKGLHFPKVTCVGIINVDNTLQMPDFRASERVFQQLVQVAGRAGRGDQRGEVYIQTRTAYHPTIQFARHHDVDGFLEQEIEFRKAMDFPPFQRAVMITFRGREEEKTQYCAQLAARKLREALEGSPIEIPEPTPAPISKLRDHFRFQIFFMTPSIKLVTPSLEKEIREVKWPDGVVAVVDVDPFSLL
ncbi:MAG: primosomal protein N' [Verrucomicrobiota bacterium]